MYTGHFAVGLALHAVAPPKVSARSLFLGVAALDLLNALFTITGLDHITPAPDDAVGFWLDFIDWDHSVLMALVWALAAAFLRLMVRRSGAPLIALAVLSHLFLDALVHRPDLALWPGSDVHLGFGLWQLFPVGAWVFELFLTVAAFNYWVRRRGAGLGVRRFWVLGVLLVMHISYAQPLNPLRLLARVLDAPQAVQAYSLLVFGSFLLPALLLGHWLRPVDAPAPVG